MKVRIGIDEAGYGPRLGPLVVALCRVDGALADVLRRRYRHLPRIADSKRIYRAGQGFEELERTALAAVACATGRLPSSLGEWLGPAPEGLAEHPWYDAILEAPLPRRAAPDAVQQAVDALARASDAAGVRLLEARACPVLEGAFNHRLRRLDSKGRLELEVISELLDRHLPPDVGTEVHCDRLGGRKFYGDFLQAHHPFCGVETLEESKGASRYVVKETPVEHHYAFLVKGDDRVPEIALASCLAKYCRELLMEGFNRFWTARRDHVRPTAGYPEDARRFVAEMAGDPLFDRCREQLLRRR